MKKTQSAIRIPMPLRYLINLLLILALWFVLYTLIQNGTITNYWSGILITVGINIILATSLNVATGYLGQGHLLGSHFLAHQADVGLGLQGALQRYMRGRTAHDLDKVPVLFGGVGITLDVADDLAVGLGGGVEAEGALNVLVLQVIVDIKVVQDPAVG